MKEKLKCPYCDSENVIRMNGGGAVKKFGANAMVEIAPAIIHCNDCGKDFRDAWFDDLTMDDAFLSR